jgi:hypothetical protein
MSQKLFSSVWGELLIIGNSSENGISACQRFSISACFSWRSLRFSFHRFVMGLPGLMENSSGNNNRNEQAN